MLRATVLIALFLSSAALAKDADCGDALNQMEANTCAAEQFAAADAELNRLYGTLKDKLDPNGRRNLVAAQRAWIAFRDPECNLRTGYDTADPDANGSIQPLLQAECRTGLTRARIRDLAAQIKCPGGDLSCPP